MKWTPESLSRELEAAREVRDSHLEHWGRMVSRYSQRSTNQDAEADFNPENHEYEYLSLVGPKVCFTAPRVAVKCRRPFNGRQTAKALTAAMNQWGEDVGVGDSGAHACRNFLLGFGAFHVARQPHPSLHGYSPSMPHVPRVYSLEPKQFVVDPLCSLIGNARYTGHECPRDADELQAEAESNPESGWNTEMLMDGGSKEETYDWEEDADVSRSRVRVDEVFVPGHFEDGQPGTDDGYSGTIFTLKRGEQRDWLRAPRSFYGPACGPYVLAGAYGVPGSPWPLSPLMAVRGKVDELNAHAVAASKAMSEYKRLVIVDKGNKDLPQMLKRPDMFVIPVAGFKKDEIVEVELGGLTEQHMTMLATLRERLDRGSGMSDALRGNVRPGNTATGDAIADQSSTVRIAYLKQSFGAAMTQVYNIAKWYMLMDDTVVFPLGEEYAAETGMMDPFFHGGLMEDQNPDDYKVQIQPYSMDFVGDGVLRQQFIEAFGLFMQMAQVMPTLPQVRWKDMFNKVGDLWNDDWGEMIDVELGAMMGGMPGALPGMPGAGMGSQVGKIGPKGKMSDPAMTMNRLAQPGRMYAGALKQ